MSRKTIIEQIWLVEADVTTHKYQGEEVIVDRVHRLVKADSAEEAEAKFVNAYEKDEPYSFSTSVEILNVTDILI